MGKAVVYLSGSILNRKSVRKLPSHRTGKKEEVTTTCAKPNRGHAQSDRGGNDREGSGGVGTLNAITQQQPSRTDGHPIFCKDFIVIFKMVTHTRDEVLTLNIKKCIFIVTMKAVVVWVH